MIHPLLSPTFSARANAVALEWACQEYTFADLDRRATRLAHELRARGMAKGDRLAIYLPNRIEYIDLFLACTRLGVIVVPINILYRDREMAHIIGDAAPRAVVVTDESAWSRGDQVAWGVDALTHAAAARTLAPIDVELDAETVAALIYTSGTTGPAKGAVITHGNLCANARTLVEAWRFTANDRLLLALPLFHVHGLGNGVHCWLLSVPPCSSVCRRCTCVCWKWTRMRHGRPAPRSGCAFPGRRLSPRKCSRISRACTAIAFSSATG